MDEGDILGILERLEAKDVEHLCVLCELDKGFIERLLADRTTGSAAKVTKVIEVLLKKHKEETNNILQEKLSALDLHRTDQRFVLDDYRGRKRLSCSYVLADADSDGAQDTGSQHACVPLCYPSNHYWDVEKRELIETDEEEDGSFVVCPDALNILRQIDGPICPVAVMGPARSGKSYITSQLQEPRPSDCIFRMSKNMDPETKGIWINTSPFKKVLDDGKEVTVVLLDTEGFGSHAAYGDPEMNMFCLTVLLSSVLIYNSVGVPRADDLYKFNWVLELVNSIQVRDDDDTSAAGEFIHFFPNFLWLLRDVQLQPIIDGHEVGIKEYVLTKVFGFEPEGKKRAAKQNNQIRTAMLTYFPDFEVYALPLPSADSEVLGNMDSGRYRKSLRLDFVEAVDALSATAAKVMKAKTAWPFAGYVNGIEFTELLTNYVQCLTSGPVDVLSVWDGVLKNVFNKAIREAFSHYKTVMLDFVHKRCPCDEDDVIEEHGKAHKSAIEIFKSNTRTIKAANLIENCVQQLVDKMAVYVDEDSSYSGGLLPQLLQVNVKRSDSFCRSLARGLVERKLNVLGTKGNTNKQTTFRDIEKVFQEIEEMYDNQARGPRKLEIYEQEIAKKIMEFYNEHIEFLSKLDYFRSPEEAEKIREGELKTRAAADEVEKRNSLKKRRRQNQIEKTAVLLAALDNVCQEKEQRTTDTSAIRSVLRHKSQMLSKTHTALVDTIEEIDRKLARNNTVKTDELEKKTHEVENRLRREESQLKKDKQWHEEETNMESEKLRNEHEGLKKQKRSSHCRLM